MNKDKFQRWARRAAPVVAGAAVGVVLGIAYAGMRKEVIWAKPEQLQAMIDDPTTGYITSNGRYMVANSVAREV